MANGTTPKEWDYTLVAAPVFFSGSASVLCWFVYQSLGEIGFMHPAAFAVFFVALVFGLISLLPTLLRSEVASCSLTFALASIYLAIADNGCETSMAMFIGTAILIALWTATALCLEHRDTDFRPLTLLWRFGTPFVLVQFAIGMYFQFYPVAR